MVVDGDGRRNAYRKAVTADLFLRPPGRDAELICVGTNCDDPIYELRFTSGTRWTFGSNNRISEIVTARGLTTRFDYDVTSGHLDQVTDGYGRVIAFQYDATDRLSQVTDPDNKVTTFSYDDPGQQGHLRSVTDPLSNSMSFEYEVYTIPGTTTTLHRITQEVLKNGRTFTCSYDDTLGNMSRSLKAVKSDGTEENVVSISSSTFPQQRSELLPVSPTDNSVTLTDGRGAVWTYQRNEWGQLIQRDAPSRNDTGWTLGHCQLWRQS